MKALKKVLTLVLAVSMVLTMGIGMGVNAADAPTSNTYDVNTDTVKLLGRHFESGDYTCFSYGAAGVEIKFSGTDLWVDIAQLDGANESTAVMVLVDTLMPMEATKYTIAGNAGWLQVAANLEDGEHFVRIIKMSRGIGAGGWFGTDWFGVRSIAVNEGGSVLTPNAYSDLVIEAYGDSITNGDAVWLNADGSSNSYTYGAYSGVVSRLLGAELQTTGNTGNGLNSWVLGAGNLFPPRESWSEEDPRASQHTYPDHSDTDIVIINLGTNDMIAISNTSDPECEQYTEEYFKQTYIEWMTQIHEDAPNAIVIGALGAMGADILFDDIQAACDAVNEAAGVEYAFFTQLVRCNSFTGGLGHDNGHPSNYAHEVYGLQIAKLANEKLGLGLEDELNSYVPYDTEFDYDNLAVLATAYDAGYDVYGGTAVAGNANDANITTGWQYASGFGIFDKDTKELFDCWLAFEYAEATTVDEMQITWEGDTRAAEGGYTVQYSDDGETWTDIADAVYVYGTDSRPEDVVTFEAVTAKYFRINMTVGTSGKDYCPKIFEVAMYGESSQTPGKPGTTPNDPTPAGKGDVNGDGQINSTDYTQVRRHFLGTFTIAEEHLDAADVDSDGQINGTDFMRIRRHFLGTYTIED